MINENSKSQSETIRLSIETRRLMAYDELLGNIGSAACKDKDNEMFFSSDLKVMQMAKTICANCSIKDICLNFAVLNEETNGVWGGTTPKERFQIARSRRLG
jgi:hypothetical protein